MMSRDWIKLISILFISNLVACTDSKSPELILANAQIATPNDPHIAEIYQRSCRSCHTVRETTAPLVGDTDSWKPRLEQGMEVLLDHVVSGFGGMPPFGMCMECDAEEFEKLIQFMASEVVASAE